MKCPSAHCHLSGYTLALSTCAEHGGWQAVLYEHVANVHVDELPVVAQTADGSLFGAHEFYDNVHELLAQALIDLCAIE